MLYSSSPDACDIHCAFIYRIFKLSRLFINTNGVFLEIMSSPKSNVSATIDHLRHTF